MMLLGAAVLLMTYSNLIIKFRASVNFDPEQSESIGNYLIDMFVDPLVWSAGIATVVAMLLWLLAIRRVELSVAQPMLAAIFILVPLGAWYFLSESLPPLRIFGLFLIASGILLVAETA